MKQAIKSPVQRRGAHSFGDGMHAHSSAKSTATEAQQERVLELLRLRPHHRHELTQAGIYHPPRRIKELRDQGFHIRTNRITIVHQWGFSHTGCALYELIVEPES